MLGNVLAHVAHQLHFFLILGQGEGFAVGHVAGLFDFALFNPHAAIFADQAKAHVQAQLQLAHLAGHGFGQHHALVAFAQQVQGDIGIGAGLRGQQQLQVVAGGGQLAQQAAPQLGALGGLQVQGLEGVLRPPAQGKAAAAQAQRCA